MECVIIFSRGEVPENAGQGHARQHDALHPPLEDNVLLLVVGRQVEVYRLVHLLLLFPFCVSKVRTDRVWRDSWLSPPFISSSAEAASENSVSTSQNSKKGQSLSHFMTERELKKNTFPGKIFLL